MLNQTQIVTYKKTVSLYVGDQLLFFDRVEYLRFFALRLGPTMFTSTKGRNIPENKGGTCESSNYFKLISCLKSSLSVYNLNEM